MCTMDDLWGKPASKTFRKRSIRLVKSGTAKVLVHAEIADAVSELLRRAEENGTQLPEELGGWVPFTSGDSPLEWGLAFECPEDLDVRIAASLGFEYIDGGLLKFSGTVEDARRFREDTETARVLKHTPNHIKEDPYAWQFCLPATRNLKAGCKGEDVCFVQLALGCQYTEGEYTAETTAAVMGLQRRWQIVQPKGYGYTGIVDEDTWKALLPTTSSCHLTYGDEGNMVRVLQAALLVYDWENEIIVTGRFDQVTLRGVRHLQDTYGLRMSGDMGYPEWAALLGRPVRSIG